MKKLISLILILCMACMLIPAMAEEDVTGVWYLVEVTSQGISVNPADMGMVSTVTLNPDGTLTAVMEMMGQKQEETGTWSLEGDVLTISEEDTTISATVADGKFALASDQQSMIYSREEPVVSDKPAVVPAESEEAFLGSWTIAAMDMMGMYITPDMFGAMGLEGYDASIIIEPGKVTASVAMGGEPQVSEMEYVFEDGRLVMAIEGMEEALKAAEEAGLSISDTTSSIEMLDNGNILYGIDILGMKMGIYLQKVDAAAEEPAA